MSMQTQPQANTKNALVITANIADMDLTLDVRTQIANTNFEPFQVQARQFLASINSQLVTEDDFAMADQDCDTLKKVEDNIRQTIRNVAAGNAEIEQVLKLAGELADEFRSKRLALEKLVDKERQARKKAIVDDALLLLTTQMDETPELAPMFKINLPVTELRRRLEDGGKNKKGLSGYQKGVAVVVTRLQLEIQCEANRLQSRLAMIPKDREYLFNDRISLVASESDLETVVYKRLREDDLRKEVEAQARREQEEAARQSAMANVQPFVGSVRVQNLARSRDDVHQSAMQAAGREALPATGNDPITGFRVNLKCTKNQAIFIGKRIKAEFPEIFESISSKGA